MKHIHKIIGKIYIFVREKAEETPDRYFGQNTHYSIPNVYLAVFFIFFMQGPSFLAYQRTLQGLNDHFNLQTFLSYTKPFEQPYPPDVGGNSNHPFKLSIF
ncbi:MAG: hypothetical protein AMR96_02705 [Candidatus Adiutrix intracellularis]|nr:MAG: hypothetical protein AMR96_02705 [Candidatus Adiutrix intracellularis]